jgi:pimeloyl-ACP methyl ester carboxylesterase
MDAYTTRRIPVGRSEVVADVWDGRGPRVLLVHGIPGWRGTWREVARRLAPAFSVVAPDLLGFGSSGPAPRGAHARAHAEALAALLDALGWGEVHVAACDFGGPTAVTLAALRPGRVRSLVLAATNLFPDTPVPLPLRLARVPALGPAAFRLAFGRAGLAAMWWAACGDRRAYPLARHRETLASDAGVASTRRILLASLRDLPALYGPVERAARLMALPAAVVWGDRDPFFPVAVGARTAGALRAPLLLLRGCGHFVPEERPDELARAVRDTIARAGDAPATITAARS